MPLPTGSRGPIPEDRDPDDYDRLRRRVLWSMPTGLFVVGSRWADVANLMTANLVMQVSTAPKLVAVAVETDAVTHGLIQASGKFSISILARAERACVRRFVKPVATIEFGSDGKISAMQGDPVVEVAGGVPVLAAAVGWLAAEVRQTIDMGSGSAVTGSHTLFIGEVVDAGERADDGDPDGPDSEPGGVDDGGVLRMEDTRMNYGG